MFDNLETTFQGKSNQELRESYYLFKMMRLKKLIDYFTPLTLFISGFPNPMRCLIEKTLFKQFVGGETIEACQKTIHILEAKNVGSILDYSVEGKQSLWDFRRTKEELVRIINKTSSNASIPMYVFKITGLIRFRILEKKQANIPLLKEETIEFDKCLKFVYEVCETAVKNKQRIMIDAEETWIQDSIDIIAEDLMRTFNKEQCYVYNTIQFYRTSAENYLYTLHKKVQDDYKIGIKIVRGAYMEKERARAEELNYPSPIHINKELTDKAFNNGVAFCIEHKIANIIGSHNEESNLLAVQLLKENPSFDKSNIFFSQLLGMSDNISFNLSKEGFNVAKYVPYGPIKEVMPYLIRRAQENTSINGQMGRELTLISKELERRKNSK